jgi:5-methylcytosine-specific restriction endonuclease McrA
MASAERDRGATWKRLRAAVMARDGGRCVWCGAPASHADHVVPRSMGGPDTLANLVAACRACNLARGARIGPPPKQAAARRIRPGW